MNIFEQVTGKTATVKGEQVQMLMGPWWCEAGDGASCFEVEDEAPLHEDGFVYWTCEQGHKNKVKVDNG